MKKIFFIFSLFILLYGVSYSNTLDGDYYIGEQKVTISHDEEHYYVTYSGDGIQRVLQYEENTPANEQIWVEWINAKQSGTLVLKPDYSSGIYTDYRTGSESYIKKIY
jgi:hypothetical protein